MFKDLFVKLLQENNVTAYKLSKDTGINESLISQWKSGRQLPKYDSIKTLCDYFDISADYLLGLTDDTAPSKRTSDTLSSSEQEMLSAYRRLDDSDQGEVRGYINGMLTKEKYRIHNEEATG